MPLPHGQKNSGGYLSGNSVSVTKKRPTLIPDKLDGPIPFTVAFEPYKTVLKVANIAPRLEKTQSRKPKTLFGFLENGHNEKVDQVTIKKSIDFLDNEDEIDLSNAPIFQILCEISEMY